MSRKHPVWADEVVGAVTTGGRVVCAPCAAILRRDVPDAYVFVNGTYSEQSCDVCGKVLEDCGTYWEPPNFPDRLRGTRAPHPGFEVRRNCP